MIIANMYSKKPRQPKKMSEKRLRNIAQWYCQRYVVSTKKLKDHLEKRLSREVSDPDELARFQKSVSGIVSEFKTSGLVSDREAASARLRAALRSGYASNAAVYAASRAAMVERSVVEKELQSALKETMPDLDECDGDDRENMKDQAIFALKRANRGPYRARPGGDQFVRRDAGWLQRRGFSLDVIQSVLKTEIIEE